MNIHTTFKLFGLLTLLYTNIFGKLVKPIPQELLIHNEILEGYNLDVRPEESHGVPLHVHFDMKLQKIVKLDVKKQEFIVNTFIRMSWRDPLLKWNKTEHENINEINVGAHLIWTPDIVLYNAANEASFTHTDVYKTKAMLSSDGDVEWTAPVTWRVSCYFDVTWFPLDKQICSLTFGSWSYMETQMTISLWDDAQTAEDDTFMIKNGEWDVTDMTIWKESKKYRCCSKPFSNIVYKITLTRMTLYYFLYIILPLISQIMLFFVIFHIPFEGGERMGFGVTILLGITVYLLVISEKLPEKSDNLPMLGLCFIAEFYILSLSIIMTAVIQKLYMRTTRPPELLLYCCLGRKKSSDGTSPDAADLIEIENVSNGSSGYLQHSMKNESKQEVNNKLSYSCKTRERNEKEREYNKKWIQICHRLDKLCFWVFGSSAFLVPVIIVTSLDKTMLG